MSEDVRKAPKSDQLAEMRRALANLTAEELALKKILENALEINNLFRQHNFTFRYQGLLREKSISGTVLAEKISEIALPQLIRMVTSKVGERHRLESRIKESEDETWTKKNF